MTHIPRSLWIVALALALVAGGCATKDDNEPDPDLIVNSLDDIASPAAGTITLRSALEAAGAGEVISFDGSLDGGTIVLTIVGEEHSVLPGEVYVANVYSGYSDRDYGKSALYARKTVVIDASGLPNGITVRWGGGDASHARVMAVYGNLTMTNVTIADGYSLAEAISGGTQPYTLARGGGLAVWGMARLRDCVVTGNTCVGDTASSRDRGTYGGGIYSNGLDLEDTVVSGNRALGSGAAGGGIYSVGGADNGYGRGNDTALTRCTVSGNRVTAQHAYGGGIFTLSGGPNNLATMYLTNCTIARNVVEDNPDIANAGQFYYRGAGIYMGGGSLNVTACTIAENATTGQAAVFSGKPNMAGGVSATIGNAHTVEYVDGPALDRRRQHAQRRARGLVRRVHPVLQQRGLQPRRQAQFQPDPGAGARLDDVQPEALAQGRRCGRRDPRAGARRGRGAVPRHGALGRDGRRRAGRPVVSPGRPGRRQDRGPELLPHLRQRRLQRLRADPTDDFLNHVILKCRSHYGSHPGGRFRIGVRRPDRDDLVRPGRHLADQPAERRLDRVLAEPRHRHRRPARAGRPGRRLLGDVHDRARR